MMDIIKQTVDYSIGVPDHAEKPITYMMSEDGIMERRENAFGIFVTKTAKVIGLAKIKESFTMKIKKMPIEILFRIISFFKWVNKEYDSEAAVLIYYDPTDEVYYMDCPVQKVTSAAVDMEKKPELEQKYLMVAEFHSHNTMGAFFSTVDDKDEQETKIYGVIGCIGKTVPEIKLRAGSGKGKVEDLNIDDVFDVNASFPEEWKAMVEKKVYTTVTYTPTTYVGDAQHWNNEDWYHSGAYGGYYRTQDEKPKLPLRKYQGKKNRKLKELCGETNPQEICATAESMELDELELLIDSLDAIRLTKENDVLNGRVEA